MAFIPLSISVDSPIMPGLEQTSNVPISTTFLPPPAFSMLNSFQSSRFSFALLALWNPCRKRAQDRQAHERETTPKSSRGPPTVMVTGHDDTPISQGYTLQSKYKTLKSRLTRPTITVRKSLHLGTLVEHGLGVDFLDRSIQTGVSIRNHLPNSLFLS